MRYAPSNPSSATSRGNVAPRPGCRTPVRPTTAMAPEPNDTWTPAPTSVPVERSTPAPTLWSPTRCSADATSLTNDRLRPWATAAAGQTRTATAAAAAAVARRHAALRDPLPRPASRGGPPERAGPHYAAGSRRSRLDGLPADGGSP